MSYSYVGGVTKSKNFNSLKVQTHKKLPTEESVSALIPQWGAPQVQYVDPSRQSGE